MGMLLSVSAVASCAHGGRATLLPAPRVKLSGIPAALAMPPVLALAGCTSPPPPAGPGPGVAAPVFFGQTLRIRSTGVPLLADALTAGPAVACASPVTVGYAGQARVKGI